MAAEAFGRGPGPGECARCGFSPAAGTTFVRQTGMLVMNRRVTESAVYCKGCATDAYRRCQAWCLGLGWWGVISFFMTWGALFHNAREMKRLAAMPGPMDRAPDVSAPRATPSDGGPPLIQRPYTLVLVGVILLAVVLALT
jgi:hypothetical protein